MVNVLRTAFASGVPSTLEDPRITAHGFAGTLAKPVGSSAAAGRHAALAGLPDATVRDLGLERDRSPARREYALGYWL
jgi:hypothetical protein